MGLSTYRTAAAKLGLEGFEKNTTSWNESIKPFWPAVISSALNPKTLLLLVWCDDFALPLWSLFFFHFGPFFSHFGPFFFLHLVPFIVSLWSLFLASRISSEGSMPLLFLLLYFFHVACHVLLSAHVHGSALADRCRCVQPDCMPRFASERYGNWTTIKGAITAFLMQEVQ